MRTVEVSDKKILLLRTAAGPWRAFSPTCPHAGAPLDKGALCGDRLICPWHKSCFSASHGELLEPPALESLQSYFLEIVGEEIRVDIESSRQIKEVPDDGIGYSRAEQTFVILGGGAAAAASVQELRALGFDGRLVMVSQESRAPYDRTLLSKMYLSGQADAKQLPLRPESLLKDCQVEFIVGKIGSVVSESREISFTDTRPSLHYDKVLVATGGNPKRLPFPGSEPHPLVLRNVEDANRLIESAEQARNAVLIGASFISMEIASAFRERGLNVAIISQEKIPLLKQLGAKMGQLLLEKHLQKGVRFLAEAKVSATRRVGTETILTLSNGQKLTADLVVSGVGIEPATAFLKGVPRNDDQSLSVDGTMRVRGVDHMFAAGDIASFPLPRTGQRVRIEHWRTAQEQAKVAAANMMGLERSYQGVPYFWTYHYGVRYEFFGHLPDQSELVVEGDVSEPKFVAAYLVEGRCQAVFSANRESETAKLFDLMEREGTLPWKAFKALLTKQ